MQMSCEIALNTPCTIEVFETIDSTADHVARQINTLPIPYLCLANSQTHGHGRRGQRWESPAGQSIAATYLWRSSQSVTGLSLVMGLAIIQGLELLGIKNLSLKWPNDIYLNNLKLGGILIQGFSGQRYAISFGLNVLLDPQNYEALQDRRITSIAQFYPEIFNKNLIIKTCMNKITAFLKQPDIKFYTPLWAQYDFLNNRTVSLNTISGTAVGINSQGCLLIRDNLGNIHPCHAGEAKLNYARE